MRAFKGLIALGAFFFFIGCESSPGAPPPPRAAAVNSNVSNVLVVNGESQPVPTSIAGTATVNVTNTPSVTISGTPAVSASLDAIASGLHIPVTVSNATLPISGNVGITGPVTTVASASLATYPPVFQQSIAFLVDGTTGTGSSAEIDVSRFRRIRVNVIILTSVPGATVSVISDDSGSGFDFTLDKSTFSVGRYTSAFDTPGTSIRVDVKDAVVTAGGLINARLTVWGWPN